MPAARNFPINGAALRLSDRGGGQPVFVQFGCGLPIAWSVGGEQEKQQCVLSRESPTKPRRALLFARAYRGWADLRRLLSGPHQGFCLFIFCHSGIIFRRRSQLHRGQPTFGHGEPALLFFFVLSAFSHAQTSCSVGALSFDLIHRRSPLHTNYANKKPRRCE